MTLLLAAAGAKLAAALAAWLLVSCPAAASQFWLPPWYYLALAWTFGAAGFALYGGGARGTPARYLGAVFVFFGTLFADRVLFGRVPCLPSSYVPWARACLGIQPIAFQALVMWRFAWTFPNIQPGIVHQSFPRAMDVFCLAAGVVLFAGNLFAAVPGLPAWLYAALVWLGTDTAQGQFWLTISLLTMVSLVMLVLKLRSARADQRRRLSVVIIGIAVATFPMVLDVVLTVTWPAFQAYFLADPSRGRLRALVLTLFALLSPASAAYAVVVEQVLDLRFIIRRAVRYSLARYSVFIALAIPVLALASYVYIHREMPLGALLAGGSLTMWVLLLITAAVLIGARRPLLDAIDRQFFREEYDARQILSSLIDGARQPGSVDLAERICSEVDRALHLERVALLLRDDMSDSFRDPHHRIPELPAATSLVHLVGGAETPLDIDLSPARSAVGRLSQHERLWLAETGARLLVPFLGSGGLLIAILVLGEKRSETPFTGEDRMLLTAVAASASFPLEARIRDSSDDGHGERSSGHTATQCERCGNIQTRGGLDICPSCHGHMRPCLLPGVLAGKFAIDRQVGIGGMGIVYQAHDLDLGRPVALKTLPKIAPRHVTRLRREARAMATIHHPHLAVIYAIEVWRGLPVLVIEFLSGGTLAERLRSGPLPIDEALSMGTAMADVLEHVHRAGMLHRDVKPSNIGYTSAGVPKLLDFGLARLTTVTAGPGDTTSLSILKTATGEGDRSFETQGATQPLVGTAAYLSPEAVSLETPDHSFDLWALAVTIYEAVAGRNPFAAPTVVETLQRITSSVIAPLRSVRPDCPQPLDEFLATALSRDPRRRPGTAAEFLASLRAIHQAMPTGEPVNR